jgi:hypothetical protein
MMRAWEWVAMAAMGSTLIACPPFLKKSGGADAGEDAVAPAASASAEPQGLNVNAANASEMARYPDEKPVDHAPVTAEADGHMRTQAGPGGDLVIVLKKGTEVEKLAEHGGYYLVVADDPKDPTRKLMGWISAASFGAAGPGTPVAPGVAPVAPVVRTDAGAAKDAGAAPAVVKDAGAVVPTPTAVPDAGAKPGKPLDVKKVSGACPAGYAPCSAVCRLTCKTEGDCGVATAHCVDGYCIGPGASPCK